MRNMATESTSSSLSALPIHKVNYAGKKRGPIKSPRRSSTSSNLEPSIEVNPEMIRNFSKRLTNNEDVNFPEYTKLRRSMDNEKENKLLKSYNGNIALQKWSQGNIKRDQLSAARNKLLHQSRPLLPVEMNKKFQSVSDIKSLDTSEITRIKPLNAKLKQRLVKNTSLTDTKDKSKTHYFLDAFKSKALMKQPASRDMKKKSKYTILPLGKSTNMSRYRNDHSTKCEFCKARSCEQQNKPHRAAIETSMINLKSVSQYQVKQKYRRSSLHLKPFSLFFRKKSTDNGSSLQVDLTSAVKCIKERTIALEKYLPNSEDLTSFCQNNVVGHIPVKNSSSLAMFFSKTNRKKSPLLRECETGLCGAKGCNQLMYCSRNRFQFKTESCEKKPECVCSTFNIKHIESKNKHEQDHCKERHRLTFSTETQNCKSESTQFSKSELLMCDSQCITCKCKSISLRKTHGEKNIKTGSKKSFEHVLDDNENGHDNEAVCLRHYVKKSQTKNSAINITSSFDFLINLSDIKQSFNTSKRPEYKNKPIIRPDRVSYDKKEPTFNRILQASSMSYLKGVYSKLFPITNTKKKDKSTLKEKTASQKIQLNRCNENQDSPPWRKQISGDKSKKIKVQNVEHESVLKRYFGFIFNKIIKNESANANIPKTYKKTEFKNNCKYFCKENAIRKKNSLLESKNLQQSNNADIHLRKNTICRSGVMNKQDIMYSKRISCENIGYCPLSIYTAQPVERITGFNKYEPLNGQKPRGRISSNFSLNVKFCKDSRISLYSHEAKQKKDNSNVNTQRPRKKIHNQDIQKTFMVNPTVMSLLQTKYINNKPETYKFLSNRVDKKLNNISLSPGGIAMKVQSQNNQTIVKYDKSHLTNLGKSELLNPNDDCRKHSKNSFSTSNTSIKVSSNKISRLKLNTACRGKNFMFVPLQDSQYKPRTKNSKRISVTKTGPVKNSLKVFRLKERKNEVTSAYCHVTYDRAGNPTCERDTTCAPHCTWIHKKGKSVTAGSHIIESFCPFEDRNFMIQPCVTQTQEDNKFVKGRPREIENSFPLERGNFMIQPCVIQTQEDNKIDKKRNNATNIISHFFNKTPAKKKCDCVCSSGDAPIKNSNTNYKPKLTIEVDTDKMNVKNREEVLKRAIKLKELEGSELGEDYAQRAKQSSCCCTGFKSKNLRCISCKNVPNRPNLRMENVQNKELLEIEMDSDSNILNRADVLKRIKKMKDTGNEYLQSEIKYSGKEHLQREKYSNNVVDFNKIKNKLKNIRANRPPCVCDNEVCFHESEAEYLKQEIAKKKENPCVCGAPSCERFSIERLVKEGKLSREDGRYLLDLIKKQEVIQKKEKIRKQKAKRKKEKERLKEKHLQKIGKAKKKSRKRSEKKSKEKSTKRSKEKLKKEKHKKKEQKKKEMQKKRVKKLSKAQRETERIKIEIQRQKREEEERKEMESMEEHKQAITLEQTFKRQMLVDDRKENKQLRKSQFTERIKRAKEKRYQRMRKKKRKKRNRLLREKEKLQNKIEQAELKKHKEKQQIKIAEKLRKHKETMKKKKKKEKKKREKKKLKILKAKMKKRILKEKKRRAKMLKKKKLREKKKRMAKIRKENERFLKEMRKLAAIEREERMKEAEKKRKLKLKRHEFMREEMKKYKDVDDRYLVLESLKEIGACCVKYTGKLFNYLSYSVRHPDLTKKKMHRAYLQPGQVVSELRQDWSESEVHDIANRIEAKILAIDRLQPIGKKLYSKPKKKRLPRHQFKKRKRNRRAPMDFGCSLYMASLRNKPYFILYWMCPWFYPHLISMLKVLRQVADAGLFVLAAFVWSPLILLWELFRTIMCCGLCTA